MRFKIVMSETTEAVYDVEAGNIEEARETYHEFPCTRSIVGEDHEIEYSIIEEKEPAATRKIQLHLEREENWYPVIEVPAEMSDDEALKRIEDLCPDEVYDEMSNKDTFDFGHLSVSVYCSANDDAEVTYSLVEEEQ